MSVNKFDWSDEINQIVTKSLVTTFGLDFLLFEDKKGGDVDTIHNVRKGVWSTDLEKNNFENREEYNSAAYHQHRNYVQRGRDDKVLQKKGNLKDHYRHNSNLNYGESRDLDHVISAYEIHNDAGRILAELDGVDLANNEANLSSTASSINRTKKQFSTKEFLGKLPETIKKRELELEKLTQNLTNMPKSTPQEQHEYQITQDLIRKKQESLDVLNQVDADSMQQVDNRARKEIDSEVNSYYQSTKFFKASLKSATVAGFKMGLRETLGIILAEIWFELKQVIPSIYAKYEKVKFTISGFLKDLKEALLSIIDRVKLRFQEILASFREASIAGFFANISSTILNIFLTTTKFWGKIIRETWLNLVKIMKLAFFNPENLTTGELAKATFKILSASVGLVVGLIVHEGLASLNTIPFGEALVDFLSALSSGMVILCLNYFIEKSEVMQKFWEFLNRFKSKYDEVLENFKLINKELDQFLIELTQLEFGLSVDEIVVFTNQLMTANSELEKNILLKQEIEKQDIHLPFEMGNKESTQSWLLGLAKK